MADGEIKGKYTAAEAKAFSVGAETNTFSAHARPCGDHRAGERAAAENRADGACRLRCLLYIRQEAGDTLSGVSFSVREHEIVGLVGANGCGKTTIGKLIAGLYRPSGGRIMLFGKPQNPKQLQKQVLFILQERSSSSSQAPSCTNCNTAMR